jgi:hypothetical protein
MWLVVFSFIALLTTLAISQETQPVHQEAPTAQSEYISEVRESVVIIGANITEESEKIKRHRPCRGWELSKEKKSLLRRLQKPKLAVNYSVHHIRYRLLSAIDGFQKYGERAEAVIQMKRDMFQGLNGDQQKVHYLLYQLR